MKRRPVIFSERTTSTPKTLSAAFLSTGYAENPEIEDIERSGSAEAIKKPCSVNVVARFMAKRMA
jgi:hypothetical protein